MIEPERIIEEYIDYLVDNYISDYDKINPNNYSMLIFDLYQTDFYYVLDRDEHRVDDGLTLRSEFISDCNVDPEDMDVIGLKPCSILEMMIALARRGEDSIMWDPMIGDRTSEWFWKMVESLGLIKYNNQLYNPSEVYNILITFLDREYAPNGKGGLFTIKNCEEDLRDVEIWCQMNWYFNSILGW